MFVVDAHAHLGPCRVFGLNVTTEELITTMDQHRIDASVVQPSPGAPDAVAMHNQIADLAEKHPGRIYGLVSLNPHVGKEDYFKEAQRCVKELGFVGLKIHTIGHAVLPLSEDADTVFQAARELKVPVMVHSGPGIPFALPSLCIPKARQYPDVSIIIAHAGFTILTGEAWVAATECDNIYLETSWLFGDDVLWLIDSLGADRVMMGADLPKNVGPAMAVTETLGLSEEQKALYLGGTAARVFGLKAP